MFRFPRVRSAWLSLLVAPALLASPAPAAAASTPAATASPTCQQAALHPERFPASPVIDNRFQPMVPGHQLTLSGVVIDDAGASHPHQIVTTVTDLTKVIAGVRTVVIQDIDFQDGQVQESELFFQAQRSDGSVWLLGEYPEEYDNGVLTGAPSTFIVGIDKARSGRAMLADPDLGTPTYSQGRAPSVGFDDCATVFQTGQRVSVEAGSFRDVLVTDEFAPNDPAGGHQRKFYAPGVGNIKVAAAGGVDPEALQLTSAKELCQAAFAKVRAAVLAQDQRGFTVSPDVYGKTPHAQRTLRADTC